MNFDCNKIYWQNFVRNIAHLREQHNLSQEKMAESLEIDVELLKKVEKGEGSEDLSVDVIYKINNAFGIEPFKLFEKIQEDNF